MKVSEAGFSTLKTLPCEHVCFCHSAKKTPTELLLSNCRQQCLRCDCLWWGKGLLLEGCRARSFQVQRLAMRMLVIDFHRTTPAEMSTIHSWKNTGVVVQVSKEAETNFSQFSEPETNILDSFKHIMINIGRDVCQSLNLSVNSRPRHSS